MSTAPTYFALYACLFRNMRRAFFFLVSWRKTPMCRCGEAWLPAARRRYPNFGGQPAESSIPGDAPASRVHPSGQPDRFSNTHPLLIRGDPDENLDSPPTDSHSHSPPV